MEYNASLGRTTLFLYLPTTLPRVMIDKGMEKYGIGNEAVHSKSSCQKELKLTQEIFREKCGEEDHISERDSLLETMAVQPRVVSA